MAFVEAPDAFLNDFGVTCQIGAGSTFLGLLMMPTEVIAGDMVLSVDYSLIAKTADVSSAARGTSITVDSVAYTVRENRQQDDGVFSELFLSKN